MHADGELPPDEARRMEAHVAGCSRCGPLVEALLGESRLLSAVLEKAASAERAERRTAGADGVTAVLVIVAAAAGVQALSRWLAALFDQTPVGLVDTRSLMLSALSEALFYLLREGASMLTSLLTVVGLLLVVTVVVGLSFWRRRVPGVFLLAAAVALAASSASALERRAVKNGTVTVSAGETVDDSLFAAGDTVSMDGVVTGNLFACARTVSVRGTVKGDLVTAAQRVEVFGSVEGNVFTFSEDVTLRGPVGHSLHAFAKHVGIDPAARIQGDAMAFAQEADVEGHVGRDLLAFAGLTKLRGDVGRHASAWTGRLRVEAPARVGGDLTAHVDDKDHMSVDPGATVVGKVDTRVGHKGKASSRPSRYSRPSFYFWKMLWLAAAFLTGLVLERLSPTLFAYRFVDGAAIAKSLGIGFLVLAAPPVAIVVLGLTMVGLPLALLALAVWVAGLYLSGIVVGALVGRVLLARPEATSPPFALALIVGLFGVTVVANVPYLGGLARFVVILLGLGIGAVQSRRAWKGALAV